MYFSVKKLLDTLFTPMDEIQNSEGFKIWQNKALQAQIFRILNKPDRYLQKLKEKLTF